LPSLLALALYDVWGFELGPSLIAFFANLLVMGWSVGLGASSLVLRCGLGAESLCWLGIFFMAPVSGIYYPIASLPEWLQPVAWAIPAFHVFEGMRSVLFDGAFRHDFLVNAIALNVV
jgi:ABC-2 type transport system permease protein